MPELLTFPETAVDVPAALRRLAENIESGRYGAVRFAGVVLCAGKDLALFSYGSHTVMEASGAFARASVLAGCCVGNIDETEDRPAAG